MTLTNKLSKLKYEIEYQTVNPFILLDAHNAGWFPVILGPAAEEIWNEYINKTLLEEVVNQNKVSIYKPQLMNSLCLCDGSVVGQTITLITVTPKDIDYLTDLPLRHGVGCNYGQKPFNAKPYCRIYIARETIKRQELCPIIPRIIASCEELDNNIIFIDTQMREVDDNKMRRCKLSLSLKIMSAALKYGGIKYKDSPFWKSIYMTIPKHELAEIITRTAKKLISYVYLPDVYIDSELSK